MPQVRELMTKDPRTVQPTASIVDAARLMRDEDTGIVPIAKGAPHRITSPSAQSSDGDRKGRASVSFVPKLRATP